MRVVTVPGSLDDRTLDTLAAGLGDWPPTEGLLLDARATHWASPYGLTALLSLGQAIQEAQQATPRLTVPDSEDVRSYWGRAGFFHAAAECFELVGKLPRKNSDAPSDVLLPVTPVRAAEDVHHVVGRIQERAQRILLSELNLEAKATMGFAMALSEACQNIVEHAGTGGWVAVQTYNWRKRLGRKVVVIAVSDSGIGFRRSLEPTEAKKVGDRWGDGAALELALLHNVSRFRDPGRGQGLAGIRRYLGRWQGKVSVRSGTARLAVVPAWDDDVPLAEHLPFFPGSQVQITIPAQEADAR
ncbi:MAG TPA: ATP-binding protein [Gemmatimonadales bacterium]|nr:ATP-binding protein [Gemmatimonadales bacterium]